MKRISIYLTLAISSVAQAADYPSMEDFYKSPENIAQFEQAKKAGMLGRQSEIYLEGCLKQAKSDADKAQCNCLADEVKKVPEKEMFYESSLSYRIFRDSVQAKMEGDTQKADQLRALLTERQGLNQKLEAACQQKL